MVYSRVAHCFFSRSSWRNLKRRPCELEKAGYHQRSSACGTGCGCESSCFGDPEVGHLACTWQVAPGETDKALVLGCRVKRMAGEVPGTSSVIRSSQ